MVIMNYPFNLIHLKYFCDAVILHSVSEAATKNFVTQSAISQGIAKLEQVIGVPLVTHSRSSFQITEEGRIVFEQAGEIFKALHEMQDKIMENKNEIGGDLSFVCTNSLGMSFIASSFKMMQEKYPQVNLRFKLGPLNFIRSSLQQRSAEFAIVVYDSSFSQFNADPLYQGRFHIYQDTGASKNILARGVLIDEKKGMYVEDLSEYYQTSLGREWKIQAELAGWEVVARFVEKGIGAGFFPDYLLREGRYPKIIKCPGKYPAFEYSICAVYRKGDKLSRAARAFLDLFKEKLV